MTHAPWRWPKRTPKHIGVATIFELVLSVGNKTIYIYGRRIILNCTPKFKHLKVKQSLYRNEQSLRLPRGWGFQISRQSAHEGENAASVSKEIFFVLIFLRGWLESYQCKFPPVTPSGIEPRTFRLIAQCLNQLRHRVPLIWTLKYA